MATSVAVVPRTAIEEYHVLSTADKLVVSLLTCLNPIFDSLELEVALVVLLALVAGVSRALALAHGSTTCRRASLIPLALLLALPALAWLHAHRGDVGNALPRFEVNSPPRFERGFITRSAITTKYDGWFREKQTNRIVLLRGVNFGGAGKTPEGEPSHVKTEGFYTERKSTTFVSRPCPLEEADVHFARLQAWGFNVLRLLVTWEAVEHQAPGVYDYEYIKYIVKLVRKAHNHKLAVFIDPHQDVWSRWTGGDGAPAWTLEKVGFNVSANLVTTGAAWTHQEHGSPFPKMVWATNYARLATATMFTLFFGGDSFAPRTRVEGVSVQEYLQSHYINAMRQLARALKDEPNVIGFDTLNEPSNGYIGMDDLRKSVFPVPMGFHIGGFDGMVLGAGFTRKIDYFSPPLVYKKTVTKNAHRVSAWLAPERDVWRQNGVWDLDELGQPRLLRPDHFQTPSKDFFMNKHMVPFFARFAAMLREEMGPDVMVFAEPHIEPREPVHHEAPTEEIANSTLGVPNKFGWAPHFYDGGTLISKSFRSWYALDAENSMVVFGSYFANKVFERAANSLFHSGQGFPVVVGETGVPFDMGDSYSSGDFLPQVRALNRVLEAFERKFLSWTLWTYVYDNSNEFGDNWNGEDLSLWSKDQVTDPTDLNSGGRGLLAAVRPYGAKIAGEPLESEFDPPCTLR